ncbi:MAG: allantoate amidohydrolase [Reinekea sp.]
MTQPLLHWSITAMPETDWQTLTQTVLDRCDQLAAISEMPDGILRQYLTAEHRRANNLVSEWAEQSGLKPWQDEVGNIWLRYASLQPDAKRLILGSHLDTVPNAGRYDGILGVMLGLMVLEVLSADKVELPFHVDVVGFGDEEGTRFGTTLIGSHAIAGNFNPEWLNIQDCSGTSMAQALSDFGLQPESVYLAALNADEILSYLEVHIEQGPVLEDLDQPLGIVTGIAGAKRARIKVQGQAGHAGTTPMHLRLDALTAAAELTLQIEALAAKCVFGEVATVGQLHAYPGATNVIPGMVEMSLDVRALNDVHLNLLISQLLDFVNGIAQKRSVSFTVDWTHQAPAVVCDERLQAHLQETAGRLGWSLPSLPSGAGHDAMAAAELCPVGMLFVRSPRGLSHHPDESVFSTDIEKALLLFFHSVASLEVGGRTS